MARNRKRAKARRSRPPDAGVGRPGRPEVAAARTARDASALDSGARPLERSSRPIERDAAPELDPGPENWREEMPGAIEHATPDVELANAQLARGRPALTGEPDQTAPELVAEPDGEDGGGGGAGGSGSLTAGGSGSPAARRLSGGRLINFLQGSWRELQRVQWPDRQQVIQATGVVIGFVIVAGVFLGIADALAGKLVTYILK